jgi:serine phosphatase RsbU (regulator of sigma subunit)
MILRSIISIAFFLIISLNALLAQSGFSAFLNKYVTNYTPKEYGLGFNAQCWSVCQDSTGIMYFGNSANILTFDGFHWDNVPVSKNSGYVRSLLSSVSGDVFWGYDGDFGVLKRRPNGKLTGISFLDKLPELDRYFSTVWRIYDYRGGIVFFTQESIFIYNPESDSIKTLYPDESFHLCFVVNDTLYVRDRSYGLKILKGDSFEEVKDGDIFHNEGIFGIIPVNNDKKLIITQLIGSYIFDKSGIKPLKSVDTDKLNRMQIIGSQQLSDGNIALNTASNGVVIINENGEITATINQRSGIADNDVKQVFQDDYDNLWLATNNGISRVNYSSPVSLFLHNDYSGLYGAVNALALFDGKVYAGTTTGLYTYSANDDKVFERVEKLSNNITALLAYDGHLFIGTDEAVYAMAGNRLRKIAAMNVRSLLLSEQNKRLFVAGENGFAVFDSGNDLKRLYFDKELAVNSIGAVAFVDESGNDNLWYGTMNSGLKHLTVEKGKIRKVGTETYNEDDNLPQSWVRPFSFDDTLIAATSAGLFRLEKVEESPETSGQEYKPYFVETSVAGLPQKGVVTSFTGNGNSYFAVLDGVPGFGGRNKDFDRTPFLSIDIGKINTLLSTKNNVLWIGANDGLARVDLAVKKDYKRRPDCIAGRISLQGDSVLTYVPAGSEFDIDYSYNSLSFTFSSRYNENGKTPLFSYKLEGYDDEWSDWTGETTVRYRRLSPGKYVFKVKSKNIYGVESLPVETTVTVLAPWYLTWWAYAGYGILFLLLMAGVVQAYTYRLKQKNIRLEKIIAERTREIREKKDEIEKQRDMIEEAHEEIKSSIAYAQRIQTALLPQNELEHAVVKDYFILFRPKDVVSGDFYWAKQTGDNLIVTAADCTGHGVPGAFMSMLGISLLNEITGDAKNMSAALILDKLRDGVVDALKQRQDSSDLKDGMDISLVNINLKDGSLSWAGAHNPLFIISESEPEFGDKSKYKIHEYEGRSYKLYDLKADKMPIAISSRMEPFTNHEIRLNPGDTIYMFSDGYIDQFGGPKGKKFMIKAFRNMLLENFEENMDRQKEIFENKIIEWMAFTEADTSLPFKQVDDMCIIGLRF